MEELLTLKEAEEIIYDLTGEDNSSDVFRSAVIVLLSASHGTDRKKLINLTHYGTDFVDFVAENLESNEIWIGGDVCSETGYEGEDGVMELMVQSMVGIGLLEARWE